MNIDEFKLGVRMSNAVTTYSDDNSHVDGYVKQQVHNVSIDDLPEESKNFILGKLKEREDELRNVMLEHSHMLTWDVLHKQHTLTFECIEAAEKQRKEFLVGLNLVATKAGNVSDEKLAVALLCMTGLGKLIYALKIRATEVAFQHMIDPDAFRQRANDYPDEYLKTENIFYSGKANYDEQMTILKLIAEYGDIDKDVGNIMMPSLPSILTVLDVTDGSVDADALLCSIKQSLDMIENKQDGENNERR